MGPDERRAAQGRLDTGGGRSHGSVRGAELQLVWFVQRRSLINALGGCCGGGGVLTTKMLAGEAASQVQRPPAVWRSHKAAGGQVTGRGGCQVIHSSAFVSNALRSCRG
jgi:hypothetical protein